MIRLSYILPCYNVEPYVAECLNSLYAQDVSEDEFEVICVNDCSTDGTRAIIADFAEKHSNLTLIDHEINLTAGGARNTGMKVAQGEYIWFVDPDDKIISDSAKTVWGIAKGENVDVLMFNYEIIDKANNFIKKDDTFTNSIILKGQDFVVNYFPKQFSQLCIVWRCLFRTTFLKKRELYYPIMRKAQDVCFLWKSMLVAERVASVRGVFYTYRRNPYSVANMTLDAHVMFSDRILRAYEIYKLLNNENVCIQKTLREDIETSLRWCVNSNLELLRQMSEDGRSMYYDEIVCNWDAVSSVAPYMNRKQKALFSTIGGKHLWLFKVKMLDAWEKIRKNG